MRKMKMSYRMAMAVIIVLWMYAALAITGKASDFDPAFYAAQYPDVVAAYGTDPAALYNHYLTFGINEHRFKNAQEAAYGIVDTVTTVDSSIVPMTYVDVDIANQQMIYYVNSIPVLSSSIVTGNVNKGNGTPTGVFYINSKIPGKRLVGPTWDVWVDRWMRFTGNVGLHDASWRKEFGGDVYTRNGSHGCVNLPSDVAKALYDMVEVGTMVRVH